MQSGNHRVYFLVSLSMLFWGVSYVWTKIVLDFYPPLTIMFFRLLVSSALMFLIFTIKEKTAIRSEDIRAFVILSFFSPFCYFIGENFGLVHVTPTVASVIIATIPIFAPMLGFLAFRERVSLLNVLGFAIGFAGIWIMVLDHSFRFTASPQGIFLLFFAVGSALANMVFLKKLTLKYSPLTIITVQNSLGALFFLPLFLIFDFRDIVDVKPTAEAIFSLLALAVFGSTLAFIFYTEAVRTIGIARTSIFGNLIPVVTAVSSFIILGEVIALNKIAGILLVIGGLFLTQIKAIRKKHFAAQGRLAKKTARRLEN